MDGTPAPVELSVGVRNFAARPVADWRHILDQARAADDAGVDRIFVADHLVFGRDLSAYGDPASGGVTGGVQPTGPDGEWLEPLAALSAMAAVTSRIKLATNVLVAPLRQAVLLAKTSSTVDVLSHGRLELGVGVGWQETEYRAVGVPFAERGLVLDETLDVCRALWTDQEVTFTGRGFELDGVHMMPKPPRPGGVPVWLGGRAIPAAARRLARYGAGWIPWGVTPANLAGTLDRMRSLVDLVFEALAALRDEGLAILLVEQLVDEVLGGIAEDVIVLDRGRVVVRDRASNLSVEDVATSIYSSL